MKDAIKRRLLQAALAIATGAAGVATYQAQQPSPEVLLADVLELPLLADVLAKPMDLEQMAVLLAHWVRPRFDAVKPDDLLAAPTNLHGTMDSAYRGMVPEMVSQVDGYVDAMLAKHNPQYHAQMARIEDQLTKFLQGGTGFNPAVENALYERSQGKNLAEARPSLRC